MVEMTSDRLFSHYEQLHRRPEPGFSEEKLSVILKTS